MRPMKIILLAVFSNYVTAGLLRHRGIAVQHENFRRFLNTSAIASTSDVKTSSPVHIPTPSTSSAHAAPHTSSANKLAATTSLEGSSPSAIKESSITALSQAPTTANVQSNAPSATLSLSSIPSASSLAAAGVVGSSTQQSHGSTALSTSTPTATSAATNLQASTQSQGSSAATNPSPTAVVQFGQSASGYFDTVTAASTLATPTIPGVQYPGTQSGNRVMATGFNEIYKKLDETSQCNPKDSNQATACISGELASCQSDGTYVLKSCPDGQSCYALPNQNGVAGINVACAVPSDAAAQLSAQSNAGNGPGAASQVTTKAQSIASPTGSALQGPSHLPETEAVQIPVQRLSSSQAAATSKAVTSTAGKPQSPTHLPETESVQMPVQRPSSTSQVAGVASSQVQPSASPAASSVSQASHSILTASNVESQQQKAATTSAPQPSVSSQAVESKQSVPTLQSFPAAQVTHQSQQATSAPSSNGPNPQQASSAQKGASSQTAAAASSNLLTDGGPLFSLPTSTQQGENRQVKATADSAPAQATSKPSPSQSGGEQPPATMTAQVPPPHLAQAASEALQPTKAAAAAPPKSSADDSGIVVVPVGGSDATVPQGAKEKVAVPSPTPSANPNVSSIYITVTVTTTAHDGGPTA